MSIDLAAIRRATGNALALTFSVPQPDASIQATAELRGYLETPLAAVGTSSPSLPAMFCDAERLLRITAQEDPTVTPYHLWERTKALAAVTRKFAGRYELRLARPSAPTTARRVG
ncbi:hypothetical protein ACFY41_06710 [Streptomyces syringium]|uniref:hypothetical protein n=1 Tax=Streptomyces syringium TaxID=76729 RepID=UPI0036BD8A40